MAFIKVHCLASGSTANSYAVELAYGQILALECGVHPQKFIEKFGEPDAYWISHKHSDHARFEKQYSMICRKYNFEHEFVLYHGTMQRPCVNRGFWMTKGDERFVFATDFYNFQKIGVEKKQHGIAMIECSHDFETWRSFKSSSDKTLKLKALQWENHACERQTVALLDELFTRNFDGEIILLHRSEQAIDTMSNSEAYIRDKFKFADVKWAQNMLE